MALSNVTYTANGVTTEFVVTFSYIEEADITVTVDDVVTTDYTFNGSGNVVFNTAPLNGGVVYISRDSDVTQRVTTFVDGSELTQEALNNGGDQSLYLHQETRDLIDTINADNSSVLGRVQQNETDIATNTSDLSDHEGEATGAHAASAIANTPSGNLAATDQQSVNNELQTDIDSRAQGAASSTDNAVPRFDSTTGKIIQNSGVIIDDLNQMSGLEKVTTKHVHIMDTAVSDGKVGSHIILDGDGYSGVEAIHIEYVSGAIPADAVEDVIHIEIDDVLASSGGSINAIDVSAVVGNAEVFGLHTGDGVAPIGQATTAFRSMSSFLVNTVDKLTEVTNVASTTNVFNAVNDTITVGNTSKFTAIRIDKNATYTFDMLLTFEYSTGVGTFSTFTPTDGTAGWLNDGDISWALTDIPSWAKDANNEYTIKIKRTKVGSFPTSSLSVKQVSVQGSVGYMWNEFGDINANSIQVASTKKISKILDEDDMASNSDTALATQQSIKAYADTKVSPSAISNVDNTSDANKPVSTATQTALDLKLDQISDVELTMQEIATPTTPSSGYKKIYPKTDGKLYSLDDAGNEVEIGSGAGGGVANAIENGSFDIDISGVTGDTNLVVSHETGSPLRGDGSLKIAKAAADASSEEVYIDFTIDSADLAQMLTVSFDQDFSDSNYSDDDAEIIIIKDPLGTPVEIPCNGGLIKGGKGKKYLQFQADATELDYRISVRWLDNGTSAVAAYIDDLVINQRAIVQGAIVTEWESYTPTGDWTTNTTYTGKYRRVGDSAEIYTLITLSGAPNATDLIIDLPSGLSVDTTKIPSGNNVVRVLF